MPRSDVPPNPLSCGCRAELRWAGFADGPRFVEGAHVAHCAMHARAERLRDAAARLHAALVAYLTADRPTAAQTEAVGAALAGLEAALANGGSNEQ